MILFLMLKFFHCIILSIGKTETDIEVVFLLWPNTTYHHHFSSHLHLIWVRVYLKHTQDIVLGCFYFPPMALISVSEDLQNSLHKVKSAYPTAKIFLGGEFNSPGIHWSNSSIADSYVSTSCREKLIEVSEEFCQEKLVSEPTRQRNILDLCFTIVILVLSFLVRHLLVLVIMRPVIKFIV